MPQNGANVCLPSSLNLMWINVCVKSIDSGFIFANDREITKSLHLVWSHLNPLSQQQEVNDYI